METKIIKGDLIKERIFAEVKTEMAKLVVTYNKVPGIAFIGFSCIPLSKYNIPFHIQSAEAVGFNVYKYIKEEQTTEEEMFQLIEELNNKVMFKNIVEIKIKGCSLE